MKKHLSIILIALTIASCDSAKEKLMAEISKGELKLFNDTTKTLNPEVSNNVLNNYLAFADTYKDDTTSAAYLFKAGDLANGLGRPEEAITIYERLRTTFPDYRKSATALFMQAFIYETSLNDKEKAKAKYKEFIEKYPDHLLVPSAKATLDQLNANMTDEELIRLFEAKGNN